MCFGGKQPEAPINRPDYKPEDASKHFSFKKIEGEKETEIPVEQDPAAPKPKKPPTIQTTNNPIRM